MLLAALVFRLIPAVAVVALFGGAAALRHALFLAYAALECLLSLIEAVQTRGSAMPAARPSGASNPSERPFIMSGKQYLLVRLLYHNTLLAFFAAHPSVATGVPAASATGGAIILLGVALRWWSMSTLGERFRGFAAPREPRGLATTGPYRYIRHPGYLALALIDLGVPLLLDTPALLPLWLAPAACVVRRISVEEPLLASNYPDEWPRYVRQTARLFPGIF